MRKWGGKSQEAEMDVVLLSGHWGLPHLAMFISDEIFWAGSPELKALLI